MNEIEIRTRTVTAADDLDRARTLELARLYLSEALRMVENYEPDLAVWRAVDAAGLLARLFSETIGVAQATGRNFIVREVIPLER